MALRNAAGRGRRERRERPPFYMCYRRERGQVVIPRTTYYDLAAQLRNENEAPQLENEHEVPEDDVAMERPDDRPEYRPDDQMVEGGELDVEHGADGNNDLFAEQFLAGRRDIVGNGDIPNLTVGEKNIEVNEDLEAPLTPHTQKTQFETLLMVLHFAIRHSLTTVAIEDLLKMINVITGSTLPVTRYKFNKIFSSDLELKRHMYCPECLVYTGEITQELKDRGTVRCRNRDCPTEIKVPGLNSKEFFVTFPLGEQIAEMLQNMGDVLEQLNYRWEREPSDNIRDVYDGEAYQSLMKDGKFLSHRYNLSLTFNTDGASVFKSGCSTMWPIFFRINELKPDTRFDQSKCMLAALWFGKKEPQMAMYFNSFLGECRDLYDRGIFWKSPRGQVINSKIITLNCVLDSGAKYKLQGTKKFNGGQACPYCDHPARTYHDNTMAKLWPMNEQRVTFSDLGYSYSIKKYDKRLKDFVTCEVSDRTNEEMRRDMEVAEARRRREASFTGYKGITSMSPMCALPFFEISWGFQIDYMHNVLQGNCRHLAELWFDSSNYKEDYYIGLRCDEIDQRLGALTPPSEISRRPRPISEWRDWHANEWRSWLFYYSLPSLKEILPSVYFKHHCILVTSIHILLGDNITKVDLETVAEYLADYVTEYEVLYGGEAMFFNVHLLLHLAKSVLYWGPLWCYSMFSFESANNTVMKFVKGTTAVSSQIGSKYSISKFLPHLLKVYTISDEVKDYCSDLMCYSRYLTAVKSAGVVLQGAQVVPFTAEERRAFRTNNVDSFNVVCYNQMIKGKNKYQSLHYSGLGDLSDNTVARLDDGTYGVIYRIMKQADGEVLLLMEKIITDRGYITFHRATGAKAKHIKICRQAKSGIFLFKTAREVVVKSILLKCEGRTYLTDFPNLIEKD